MENPPAVDSCCFFVLRFDSPKYAGNPRLGPRVKAVSFTSIVGSEADVQSSTVAMIFSHDEGRTAVVKKLRRLAEAIEQGESGEPVSAPGKVYDGMPRTLFLNAAEFGLEDSL